MMLDPENLRCESRFSGAPSSFWLDGVAKLVNAPSLGAGSGQDCGFNQEPIWVVGQFE